MSILISCICSFLASLAFGIIFNIKGKNLLFSALGGTLGWFFYVSLAPLVESEIIRYFISAISITLYAEKMAKIRKAPSVVFLVIGLIPLVPGYTVYKATENLMLYNVDEFINTAVYAFQIVMAIATGFLLSSKMIKK